MVFEDLYKFVPFLCRLFRAPAWVTEYAYSASYDGTAVTSPDAHIVALWIHSLPRLLSRLAF